MGRPEQIVKKQGPQKSPISKTWISTFCPCPLHTEQMEGGSNSEWQELLMFMVQEANETCFYSSPRLRSLRRPRLRAVEDVLLSYTPHARRYNAFNNDIYVDRIRLNNLRGLKGERDMLVPKGGREHTKPIGNFLCRAS